MDIKPLKYLSEILMSLLFVNDKTSEIIKQIKKQIREAGNLPDGSSALTCGLPAA